MIRLSTYMLCLILMNFTGIVRCFAQEPTSRAGPGTITLWEVTNPDLSPGMYRVTANILVEGEEGREIQLELLNHIDGNRYFTKSPPIPVMGKGNTNTVSLEFQPGDKRPTKLELVVTIPNGVAVTLNRIHLEPLGFPVGIPGQWWSMREGAFFGAVAGSGLGIIGALVGVLAAAGRARTVVRTLAFASFAFGIICLLAGITSLIFKQPYHVYYPLLLIGFLGSVVMGLLLPRILLSYRSIEQRRMQAVDM